MNTLEMDEKSWIKTSEQIFWGEIAPCDHVVQIYENDTVFLDLLSGFVDNGIRTGECVIIIATKAHLMELEKRLDVLGYSVSHLISKNQYVPLDAEEILSQFMVNDWPDQNLFNHMVGEVLTRAKGNGRKVRAFGEMVAILWANGHVGATIRLEQLWNKFCEKEAFCLFCAYPKSGFTQDARESIVHICGAHSKMIASESTAPSNGYESVLYRNL